MEKKKKNPRIDGDRGNRHRLGGLEKGLIICFRMNAGGGGGGCSFRDKKLKVRA